MAAGLQIFNENGQIIFDLGDISHVVYGKADTGYNNGSITDTHITEKSFIFVYYTEHEFYKNLKNGDSFSIGDNAMEAYPLIKIEKGKISWMYNSTMASRYHKVRYKFFYGGAPND